MSSRDKADFRPVVFLSLSNFKVFEKKTYHCFDLLVESDLNFHGGVVNCRY